MLRKAIVKNQYDQQHLKKKRDVRNEKNEKSKRGRCLKDVTDLSLELLNNPSGGRGPQVNNTMHSF